jgi:glycine oxidase
MPAQGDMASISDKRTRDSYDVVVIGAGVIGLASAWRAAQSGLRTLVVDAGAPGTGATGAAAGMLAPVTEATFGEQELLALNLESARRYRRFVAELEQESGIDSGYRSCGTLAIAIDRDDAELLKRLHRFQRSLGLEAEWLRASECRKLEPGLAPRLAGGIRSRIDHQVNPRSLTAALVRALERANGELRPGTAATLAVEGERVSGVVLESGERVAAGEVVVAAGWRSGTIAGLPATAGVPVRPVKGQILRLRGPATAPVASRVVRTPEVYLVPRPDGELIVGATVEERGPDETVTAGGVLELLRAAYEALPGVAELELVEATTGLRPCAPDNKPIVGRGVLEGLVWATAHWRHGILLAPVTADGVADLLNGRTAPRELGPFGAERFGVSAERALATASGEEVA